MGAELSSAVADRLARLFAGADLVEATRLLEEDCAESVPGVGMGGLDRVRIAVIKLSGGTLPGLVDAIVLAQTDFRDALVAAGFGHDVEAHSSWWPEPTQG